MTGRVVVVGAGPTGLGAATTLAAQRPVMIVDRIPVPGGEHGWESQGVRDFSKRAAAAGIDLRLGMTALRWSGQALLVTGPAEANWLEAAGLVYAGGLRPASASELGLVGDRPAGLLPATVADHLLSSGAALWRRAVVIGTGPWAPSVAARITATGGHVTAVVEAGDAAPWANHTVETTGGLCVRGRGRVDALHVTTRDGDRELACDAVILAADPRPNRNIDGAITAPAPRVLFAQPQAPHDLAGRYAAGRQAAQAWLDENGGPA